LLVGCEIMLARAFNQQIIALARAELAARHDPLTGLNNRAAFDIALAEAFARYARYGERFALFGIDLDSFKGVNDRLGHQAGDELLRRAADRLRDVVDGRGWVARVGGDEFAIIARGLSDPYLARALADDVASRFDVAFALEAGAAVCRASVGFALAPSDGDDAKSLIAHADSDLYRAKREVKEAPAPKRADRVDVGKRRRELSRDMKSALARGEFFLQFEPIVSLTSGRIESFEALARWRHRSRGLIPPREFIGIAERNGFVHELGEWFINEACAEASRWSGKARIAIRVSGQQLCDERFASIFDRALESSGLAASLAQIEVAESASLAASEEAGRALRQLRERGVEIALDSFGAGYAPFELIRRLPVGRLKIPRGLVADLPLRRDSAAVVEAVIALARALDLSVTAYGVESESQRDYLQRLGCSAAQGPLISIPLDAVRARALIEGAQAPLVKRSAA
jgi:diguanylate cyclase (GGDEF)-like protein